MKPGDQVQHPDCTTPGVIDHIDDGMAVVRFAGPDGWPFPQMVRVPLTRLKRYTPPAPPPAPFIPAPF